MTAAVALLDHPRDRGPGDEEDAGQVDVDHAAEQLGRHLDERDPRIDAGVIDENVDAVEALDGALDEALDVARGGDVGGDGERTIGPLLGRQLLGGRLGSLGLHVCDDDVGAGFVQAPGDAQPDAGGGTGDDRRLAGEAYELRQQRALRWHDGVHRLQCPRSRAA